MHSQKLTGFETTGLWSSEVLALQHQNTFFYFEVTAPALSNYARLIGNTNGAKVYQLNPNTCTRQPQIKDLTIELLGPTQASYLHARPFPRGENYVCKVRPTVHIPQGISSLSLILTARQA